MAVCQIREREERQEETKSKTDSGKTADLETGKTPAHGCPGRFGTLGRGPIKMAGNLHLPKDFFLAELGLAQARLNELLVLVQLYEALGGRLASMRLGEFQITKSRLWIVFLLTKTFTHMEKHDEARHGERHD